MSKTIEVKGKWAGTVEIADPLTIPQVQLIEAGLAKPEKDAEGKTWLSAYDANRIPALLGCVTKWNLEGFPENLTVENFPASPRKASNALVNFLFLELINIYTGDTEVPNE